jgi:CheY-like chemotaxis protein
MQLQMQQNILLVDDHPENLLALESILENPGLNFVRAASGEEALHLLLKHDIALILLDIHMPGMDGFETARLIHGRQRTQHIPIIFITAFNMGQQHVYQGYQAGAVDYLFKPIEPDIVRSKVHVFLELDRQRRILEFQNLQLSDAKKNSDNILLNVEEGFFLLDREYRIKPQYSQALDQILGRKHLADQNFISILQKSLSPSLYQNSKDYLELMFRSGIDEIDFKDLNPLNRAEYFDPALNCVRYLSFNFKRIYRDDQISELIVTVTDNSEQVLLESKLQASEEQSKRQVDLLHILHSEPLLLREFLRQTEQELQSIKQSIREISNEGDLQSIYREMHSIKGNSSLLEFSYLALKAHQFEEIFKSNTHPLYGVQIDEPALSAIIKDMISTVQEINAQILKISSFYEQYNSPATSSGELIIKAVSNLVNRLNREFDQQVDFVYKNFDPGLITAKDFLLLKDVMIQLTHNSLSHGIETAAERKRMSKNLFPTITLSSRVTTDALLLSFRDDGRGLQLEALREKAKNCGKWPETEIYKWTDEQVEQLVFEPGITTTRIAGLLAGRGMGMDIVKQKVQKLGGEVVINSQVGKYCEFIIRLPFPKVSKHEQIESLNQATNCI